MAGSEDKERRPGVGLALSGGGFRATLFHIGALWRLNELGYLPKLKEVTSVSGGSITAAWLGLRWRALQFQSGTAVNFEDVVAKPLKEFCARTIDIPSTLTGWLLPFRHPSDSLISSYRKHLFGDATLAQLPAEGAGPEFTIYATSLQTGASVRFSHKRLADYRVGEIPSPTFSLAQAVAASSAFPPIYVPLKLKTNPSDWRQFPDGSADLYNDADYRSTLYLGDGGIYDNMGLERVWDRYETVLMSDAGSPFSVKKTPGLARWSQIARLLRTLSIINRQSRGLRRRRLVRDYVRGDMGGTFWRIATDIEDYPLTEKGKPGPMTPYTQTARDLADVRTRLNKFNDEEQGQLINWGYALTDAALRAYVLEETVPAGSWPVPEHRL